MTGALPSAYEAFFRGRTVTLMGLGLLGRGVGDAAFLARHCAKVLVTDLKTEAQLATSIQALRDYDNIEFSLGEHPLSIFSETDFVVKAAGVPLQSPHISHARASGVPVYMSSALFAHLTSATIVGVTGTRGKSTTTQMIHDALRAAGKSVLLGGNVRGVSTIALLPEATHSHIVVLELDSWQLQGFDDLRLSPHLSVFTSFYPDHMNYYNGDMDRYLYDKCSIFRHQRPADVFIAPLEVMNMVSPMNIPSRSIVAATLSPELDLQVRGDHNRLNAGLAHAAGIALGLEPVPLATSLRRYEALEGRLQLVREWNNIAFYNDSNATTQDATLAALRTFGADDVILIWGGADKGLPIDDVAAFVSGRNVRFVALPGTGTDRLKQWFPEMRVMGSMSEAVDAAICMSTPGSKILLSPGFASFGGFENEYDRSDQFIDAVANL